MNKLKQTKRKFSIKNKLIVGFSSIFLVFVVAIGLTSLEVNNTVKFTQRLIGNDLPLFEKIEDINIELQISMSSIRAWIDTGNEKYKNEQIRAWGDIKSDIDAIDGYSKKWTDNNMKSEWAKLKASLMKLKEIQDKVINLAHTKDAIPVIEFFNNTLKNEFQNIYTNVNNILKVEINKTSANTNKQLLIDINEIDNSLRQLESQIHIYILSGKEEGSNKVKQLKQQITSDILKLDNLASNLTSEQKLNYQSFNQKYQSLSTNVDKALGMRGAKDWNLPHFLLENKATPALNEVLALIGHLENNITSSGGITGMLSKSLHTNSSDIEDGLNTLLSTQWLLLSIGLILIILITWLTSRSIVNPIRRSVDIANGIASGRRDLEIIADTNDETKDLLNALKEMNQSITEGELKIKASEEKVQSLLSDLEKRIIDYRSLIEKISKGDLRKSIEITGDDDLSKLGEHLNVMKNSLAHIAKEMMNSSHSISSGLNELESTAAAQAASSNQQASSVAELSNVIQEIKATSTQTLEKASQLGSSASKTQQESEKGKEAILKTIENMTSLQEKMKNIADTIMGLSDKTQQIGEITEAVGDLSKQSKLLALNASIEAAKAGEAGKGFAVVAGEVKALADQSQQSTERVQKILQSISDSTERAVMATEEGNKAVNENLGQIKSTGDLINELSKVIEDSSIASQQIVAAVREETAGIEQVVTSIGEIDKVTQQFNAATEQTKQAVSGLNIVAKSLRESVSLYKINKEDNDN